MAITKQRSFSAGIALESHQQITKISQSTLPPELIYALLQHSGSYAQPIVKPKQRVLKGELIAIAQSPFATPIHAASSGIIKEIAPRIIARPANVTETCIIIETDGLDEACSATPCLAYQLETTEALHNKIAQAGIVGLGDAAFPAAVKLHNRPLINTLIINGTECEPSISCDASLMQTYADKIVQGALMMQYILQAKNCMISIKNTLPMAQQALQKAIKQEKIQLVTAPAIDPMGGEKQLIKALTGVKIPAHSLPSHFGIVCQNVGTAYAVYQAIYQGIPLTERIITITGKGIKQTKNIHAKLGTPIKYLVAQCGGYTKNVQRLIMGGPMTGVALSSDDIAVIKATNCLLVMTAGEITKNHCVLPCIRCGHCATVCPAELLPQQLYWYSRSKQFEQCQDYQLFNCIECGYCDIVCPSHIPLVQSFRAVKDKLISQQKQLDRAKLAKTRHQNQQRRREKEAQEKQAKAEKRQAIIDKMRSLHKHIKH